MESKKEKKITKKFAKPHRIVSYWSDLIDAEDYKCQHHGDGEMSHNSEISLTTNVFEYCTKKRSIIDNIFDCKMA